MKEEYPGRVVALALHIVAGVTWRFAIVHEPANELPYALYQTNITTGARTCNARAFTATFLFRGTELDHLDWMRNPAPARREDTHR